MRLGRLIPTMIVRLYLVSVAAAATIEGGAWRAVCERISSSSVAVVSSSFLSFHTLMRGGWAAENARKMRPDCHCMKSRTA